MNRTGTRVQQGRRWAAKRRLEALEDELTAVLVSIHRLPEVTAADCELLEQAYWLTRHLVDRLEAAGSCPDAFRTVQRTFVECLDASPGPEKSSR